MKKVHIGRVTLIQSALQKYDPDASNGVSNLRIRHFGADIEAYEVAI